MKDYTSSLEGTGQDLILSNWIMCSSVLISKQLLEKSGYFPEESEFKSYEDWVLRVGTMTRFQLINQPLITYNTNSVDSVRINQVPWHIIKNKLINSIFPWSIKMFWNHPNKSLLLQSVLAVIKKDIWK
ncbi:MAG: hypothetical protein WCG44_01315 [bacterium]